MQFSVEISPEHPALPGHFPGMPVVPAVILIERLADQLERLTGREVNSIRQLRLLGPALPGQRLDVIVNEKSAGSWRVTCTSDGKPVAKGVFATDAPEPERAEPARPDSPGFQSASGAYQHLPHAGAMQLVDQIAFRDDGAETRLDLDDRHPLASGQSVAAWMMLEYAAQLMACRKILQGGEPMHKAMIVLVRSLDRYTSGLSAGDRVTIRVLEGVAQPGAVQCGFCAISEGRMVASGEFTVVSQD